MPKDKGGRPTVMTESVLQKLKESFLMGLTDSLACLHAGIAEATLYDYCKTNKEFAEKKEAWKRNPGYKARKNIMRDIEIGDVNTSKWYLERKCKDEFSLRTEQTGKNGGPIQERIKYIEKKEIEEYENHIEETIKPENNEKS